MDPPTDLENKVLIAALADVAGWLQAGFGSPRVPYGKYFRVGRKGGNRTCPVGGGSVAEAGRATVRAISLGKVGRERVGRGGQTSTQVVILTDPPESDTVVPLGASDHPESGHWDDQAEKLFSHTKATLT